MTDILDQAKHLCHLPHSGGHFKGRYLDISEIVRDLVNEIEHHRDTDLMYARDKQWQKDYAALHRQLAAKDALNTDLMANCNQLRDRCWKAEGELARWRKIAIDEKATLLSFAATISPPMPEELIEFFVKKANENKDKKRSIAAKELNLQVMRESGYVGRLEAAYIQLEYDSLPSCPSYCRSARMDEAKAALAKILDGK